MYILLYNPQTEHSRSLSHQITVTSPPERRGNLREKRGDPSEDTSSCCRPPLHLLSVQSWGLLRAGAELRQRSEWHVLGRRDVPGVRGGSEIGRSLWSARTRLPAALRLQRRQVCRGRGGEWLSSGSSYSLGSSTALHLPSHPAELPLSMEGDVNFGSHQQTNEISPIRKANTSPLDK